MLSIWFWIMYCWIPTFTTDSNTRMGMIWVTLNMPSAVEDCRKSSEKCQGISHCLESGYLEYGDWYTGRWWVGCYIWYSEERTGWGRSPPRPLLTVPNVTAHPSTTSVPIIVLLHNGPLLCGSNVAINWSNLNGHWSTICDNCSSAQLWYTTEHRTVMTIIPLIRQTITTAQLLSTGWKGSRRLRHGTYCSKSSTWWNHKEATNFNSYENGMV